MIKSIVAYFRKYPYALVMLFVMLIWMVIDSIQANEVSKQLEKEGKFTLATITNIRGAHSGRYVSVDFEIDGHKYSSEGRNETIPLSWIGEKIFIKFLPSDPVQCDYYDEIEIPDSILLLPPTVWDSLPIPGK